MCITTFPGQSSERDGVVCGAMRGERVTVVGSIVIEGGPKVAKAPGAGDTMYNVRTAV